jgi:hypothetical protein
MLFDRGNALKGVIDFFLEAGDILDLFSEIVEIPANRFKFALNTCQLSAEIRDVVLRRHLAFDIGDVVGDRGEAALTVERITSSDALRFLVGFFEAICEVYHGGRRGHECADGLDVKQHEKRKKSARILEARIMRTGCDVHHGCWMRTDARGAGLSRRIAVGFGARSGAATPVAEWGRAGFEGQAAASKTWQPKHRDGGGGQAPKPRSGARLCAGLYARRQTR